MISIPMMLLSFPQLPRTSHSIHLRRDCIEQSHAVIALFIKVEVRAVLDIGEVWFCSEALEHSFKLVGGTIKIERICGSYDEVNLSLQIWSAPGPVCRDDVRKIVMISPVGDDGGIDIPRFAVEHLQGTPVGSARREDPLEGSELAA